VTLVSARPQTGDDRRAALNAIDTDVHQDLPSHNLLMPYLAREWHPHMEAGLGFAARAWHNMGSGRMDDSVNEKDNLCAGDPEWVLDKLIRKYRIDFAILTGTMIGVGIQHNPRFLAALTSAYNQFVLEHWVRPYDCFKGSIVVTPQDAEFAAQEIRRLGDEVGMVQVLMPSAARIPYGQRCYWPIYAAACDFDLPVAVHVGAEGTGIANPPTSVGYPSTYLEFHSDHSQTMMGHCTSLLTEGAFEEFPNLRFCFMEGGVSWAPAVIGRLDRTYRAFKAELPWLKKLPSEYLVGRLYWSTQPIEEPEKPEHLLRMLEMMRAERTVVLATDYPHWDFDNPFVAFSHLPVDLRRRIFVDNVIDYCGPRILRPHRPTPPSAEW
jgi:predicted TIM-barrel fold metal-dependent hydrolase